MCYDNYKIRNISLFAGKNHRTISGVNFFFICQTICWIAGSSSSSSSSIASKYCRQKLSVDYYKATTICMTTISQHHNNIAESINYSPFNWEFDIRFVGWIHQRKGTKAIDFDWWCRVQRYVRPWTICVCVDNSNSKGNYRKSPTIQRTVKIKSATTFSPLSSFFGFASVFSFNPMLMWDVQAFLRTDFEGCVWVFVNELRKNVNWNKCKLDLRLPCCGRFWCFWFDEQEIQWPDLWRLRCGTAAQNKNKNVRRKKHSIQNTGASR